MIRKLKRKLYAKYRDLYDYLIVIHCKLNRPITVDDLLDQTIEQVDGQLMWWMEGYWFPLIDQYPKLWDVGVVEQNFIDLHLGATRRGNQQFYLTRDADEVIEHLKQLDYLDIDVRRMISYPTSEINTSEIFED